jgi:hypothetical protein
LLGVLLFVLFPYAAKAKGARDSFAGQKNKAPGKQQNDVIDPSKSASYLGHWFLVGGGFHYNSYPVADYLPVTRELSWDAALEYSMRLTRFSELSFLLDYQSLHPESLEGHQIGYSLSYKYHLAGLTIPDFFSFYFEFSLGLADYLHEDITAMRTAGSSVGLGGQFYLGDRWLVRLSSRYRWLRYSLPESAGDSPEINSLVFYLSMGMRHLRFDG